MVSKRKFIQLLLKSLLIGGTVSSMTITLLLLFRDYETIDEEVKDMNQIGFKFVSNLRQYNRYYASDGQFYPRVKVISGINTVLRELISLSNLIGGVQENHYLTQTSGISMAILWISSHLDNGVELLYTTGLFITSHVLQFFLIIITLWFAYLIQEDRELSDKRRQTNGDHKPTNNDQAYAESQV